MTSILYPYLELVVNTFVYIFPHTKKRRIDPRRLQRIQNMNMATRVILSQHTHTRKLDYHPHIHVVIPGGGVDQSRRQWKKNKGKYLFNKKALAKVFRGRFLAALNENNIVSNHNGRVTFRYVESSQTNMME